MSLSITAPVDYGYEDHSVPYDYGHDGYGAQNYYYHSYNDGFRALGHG